MKPFDGGFFVAERFKKCVREVFGEGRIREPVGGAIDAERFEALSGTTSLPFAAGKHKRVAVKVIDPRGNEVMAVIPIRV